MSSEVNMKTTKPKYLPTQESLIAYVMMAENKTRQQAIAQNRRHFKDFDQLPKGKTNA